MSTDYTSDSIQLHNSTSNATTVWEYKPSKKPWVPRPMGEFNRLFRIMFLAGVIYVSLFLFYILCFIIANVSTAFLALPALAEYMSSILFNPIVMVLGFLLYILGYIGHRLTYFYLEEENYLLHCFVANSRGNLFHIYYNDSRFLNYFNLQAYAPSKLKNEKYAKNPNFSQETKIERKRQDALLSHIDQQNIMVSMCKNDLQNLVGNQVLRILKIKEYKNHFQLSFTTMVKNKKGDIQENKCKIRVYNNMSSYEAFLTTCKNYITYNTN